MATLKINGATVEYDAAPETPLLWVIRDVLGMQGTKFGCGQGLCGACTVHLSGAPIRSCQTPVGAVGELEITTIEGLAAVNANVQRAWLEADVPQCGYCQPGQMMSAAALIANNKTPSDADIDNAMRGNICRCGTYDRIRTAIKRAAELSNGGAA